MAVSSRRFPRIPLDASKLSDNLKLYSDDVIQLIKSKFIDNGRYHSYENDSGVTQQLPFAVYVLDGRYFAVYPGKELLLGGGESSFGKAKLAQDLDSGEWVVDKLVLVDEANHNDFFRDDVENEKNCLRDNHQAIVTGAGEVASLYRPFKDADEGIDTEDGKYDFFMKYAYGKDLQEWLDSHSELSALVKLEISLGLVRAVQEVHDHNIIHRDIKLRNAIYNMLRSPKYAVQLVDFGLAVHMDELGNGLIAGWGTPGYMAPEIRETKTRNIGEYGTRSDIYALGVTLGRIWGFINIDEKGVAHFNEDADFAGYFPLKRAMTRMIRSMMHDDLLERPDLNIVIFQLQKMLSTLPEMMRVLNVGFLDIRDIVACRNEQSLQALVNSLSGFDQIRLFCTHDYYSDQQLMIAMQALEARGCVVSEKIYKGSLKKIEEFVMLRNRSPKNTESNGRVHHMQMARDVAVEPQLAEPVRMEEGVTVRRVTEDVDTYDLSDCFGWFFGNLRDDACHAGAAMVRPVAEQFGAGCFGFFSRDRSPVEYRGITNPLYERDTDSDSDSEEFKDPIAMARY